MAYTIGKCPQCGNKIIVRDVDGSFNSVRQNYRSCLLTFADGTTALSSACSQCENILDKDIIYNEIVAPGSQAGNKFVIASLISKGAPTSVELVPIQKNDFWMNGFLPTK